MLPTWSAPLPNDCDFMSSELRLLVDRGIAYLSCIDANGFGKTYAFDTATGVDLGLPVFHQVSLLDARDGWIYGRFGGHDEGGGINFEAGLGWWLEHWAICTAGQCEFDSVAAGNGVVAWGYQERSYDNQGESRGGVAVVKAEDGSLLWNVSGVSSSPGNAIIADGMVYAAGYDGRLHAFRASDGHQVWKTAGLDVPVIGDGMGYSNCGGDLCGLLTSSGAVVWRAPGGGPAMALANGVVYGSYGAFNAKTGAPLANVTGVVANGMVYSSQPGMIFAYGIPR
jgi:outer membrane protein assembly factor BamB